MGHQTETRAGLEIERHDGGVVVLRLARPERRNAVDIDTARAYTQFLTDANVDATVRSIVLTGTQKNYCTGADVPPSAPKMSSLDYRYATEDYRSWFKALWEVEKPVISAVNGNVAGAGWMLALLADLVVANADARWTHVFSRRGMVPHAGDPYFLSKIIPFHRLSEIALLSDTLTSTDLDKWGLINRCVGADEVLPTAMELATRLAAGPTRALGLTKRLYRRALSTDMATAFEDERNATALISTTKDRVEGVMSFVENRPPNFIGD
ncbi:MAG: enoyl-CoA hydratase/isomerase family protein [Actinomycetota bacterium]|nr:enoyl-CoA hydratase/isomerase family protein [Actinomycetota bacterium]